MFKIQLRWENGSISELTADKNNIVLGRAPESDVFLASEKASREHARIFVHDDKVFVEDLNSANGTFVRNQKIQLPTRIGPDDPIKLGDVFIRVSYQYKPREKTLSFGDGGYTLAQRMGNRNQTSRIGSGKGAELRKMLADAEKSEAGRKR